MVIVNTIYSESIIGSITKQLLPEITQTFLRLLLLRRLRLRLPLKHRCRLLHLPVSEVLLERVGLFVLEDTNPTVDTKIRFDVSGGRDVVDVQYVLPQFEVPK